MGAINKLEVVTALIICSFLLFFAGYASAWLSGVLFAIPCLMFSVAVFQVCTLVSVVLELDSWKFMLRMSCYPMLIFVPKGTMFALDTLKKLKGGAMQL